MGLWRVAWGLGSVMESETPSSIGVGMRGEQNTHPSVGQRLFLRIYMRNLHIYFAQNLSKYSKNTQNNAKTAQKREKSCKNAKITHILKLQK